MDGGFSEIDNFQRRKDKKTMDKIILTLILFPFLLNSGCVSSTEGGAVGVSRKQLLLVPSEQITQESEHAYAEMKKTAAQKGQLDRDRNQLNRINNIAKRLIPVSSAFRNDAQNWNWEVHVISSPELNAFCMPGGKIMFYTGLIDQLKLTDGEIAAVMGHEIAHALREHGRERFSQALVSQLILQTGLAMDKISPTTAQLSSAVATLAVFMPFGRSQEIEADEIGVELMARAGYNPDEALSLWKKMSASGGGKPPEILSTHPSDSRRLASIESMLPKVRPIYNRTQK